MTKKENMPLQQIQV